MWYGRFAALVAAGVLTSCSSSGPELLRDGARLIDEGNYAAAVRKLEGARDQLPQVAAVWNHLGVAYHGNGQAAEAVQAYTQALALDRNLAAARFNLGCLRLEQGQFTQAVGELTTFTGLQPKTVEGWIKLSAAQTGARLPDAAERSLQSALKLDPSNADAWNRLGLLHWNRRRVRDAQTAFESALRHRPDSADALLNLAVLHHAQPGDRTMAVAFYRKYLSLTPRRGLRRRSGDVRQLETELAPVPRRRWCPLHRRTLSRPMRAFRQNHRPRPHRQL
ncbi:MAG: tetratricopeptide repeat protein [Rhodobacteraceae bacterium]|nr:tetratricopeptide repeat protein [Paracoccaceae bacterium]